MKCLLTLVVSIAMVGEASACWLFGGFCRGGQSNCQPCQPQGKLHYTPLGQYPGGCQNGVCPAPTTVVPAKPAAPKELPPKLEKPAPKELKIENDRPAGDGSVERPYSKDEFIAKFGFDPFAKESTVATAQAGSVQESLLALHNAERARAGLPALVLDAELTRQAEAQSQAQAAAGRMHHGRIVSGSENVAQGQTSPEAVTADWMASSGHRRNILGQWSKVGFALVEGGASRNGIRSSYWTARFE